MAIMAGHDGNLFSRRQRTRLRKLRWKQQRLGLSMAPAASTAAELRSCCTSETQTNCETVISHKRRKQTQALLHLSPDHRQEGVDQVVVLHAQLLRRLRPQDGVAVEVEPARRCQSVLLHLIGIGNARARHAIAAGGDAARAGRHLIDLTSTLSRPAYATNILLSGANFLILKFVSAPSAYQSIKYPR